MARHLTDARFQSWCGFALAVCVACTDDGGGGAGGTAASGTGGTGGAAGAGTGGGGGSAGSMGGVGGSGGSSGGAGGSAGNGGSTGAHCDPPDVDVAGIEACWDYDPEVGGIPPDPELVVYSFALGKATTPDEAYAFSVEIVQGSATVELWGSDAECGRGQEMLFSLPSDPGTECFDSVPMGTYTHLLLVKRKVLSPQTMVNHTFCPGATCPSTPVPFCPGVECKLRGPVVP